MKTNGFWFSYTCQLRLTKSPENTMHELLLWATTTEFALQASFKERMTTPEPIYVCSRNGSVDHMLDVLVISTRSEFPNSSSYSLCLYFQQTTSSPVSTLQALIWREGRIRPVPTFHRRAEQAGCYRGALFSATTASFSMKSIPPFSFLQRCLVSVLGIRAVYFIYTSVLKCKH